MNTDKQTLVTLMSQFWPAGLNGLKMQEKELCLSKNDFWNIFIRCEKNRDRDEEKMGRATKYLLLASLVPSSIAFFPIDFGNYVDDGKFCILIKI